MKFSTGAKIEKAVPYVTAILTGITTFAVTRLYGKFCEEFGMDEGIDGTIDAMGQYDPAMKENFMEDVGLPNNMRFHR